jgi:hypothetical protein
MTRYSEMAKRLNIDPNQGVEKTLAEVGELIIGGRLVRSDNWQPPRYVGEPALHERPKPAVRARADMKVDEIERAGE